MAVDFDELREIAEEIIDDWGGPGQIIKNSVVGGTSFGGDTGLGTGINRLSVPFINLGVVILYLPPNF